MYAKQYADFDLARRTLDSITPGRGLALCVSCGECRVKCANSVNIGRKIDELKLIYA
jgi:heterodisulfide reductase subunit C